MSDQALRRSLTFEEVVAEQDIDLVVASDIAPAFFSGIRTYVVNGIAQLLFYAEQPGAAGDVEHILVARSRRQRPLAVVPPRLCGSVAAKGRQLSPKT
jgi:hypothetical protein